LISYSTNIEERFHRAATYVDRILKGAKPSELPIEQPDKIPNDRERQNGKSAGY
jgi:putative tryptophan/tyrosine transport system substrate-binding protein